MMPKAAGDMAATAVDELRGARVLLVDDDDIVREVCRSLLEDAGLIVEEACDGAQAVSKACGDAARYSLILMDLQMPKMDGLAAVREIHARLGERAVPVVALTAAASEGDKQACREAGMIDHMVKPIDPDTLIAVLNRCARREAAGAAGIAHVAPPRTARSPNAATAAALPAVPGFDLAWALHSANGKTALLRSMLARFGRNYAGVVAELHRLIGVGQHAEARRLAHTLKGAAATLGGTSIAQAAAGLEQALQARMLPAASSVPFATESGALLSALDLALRPALPALLALGAANGDAAAAAPAADHGTGLPLPPAHAAAFAELRRLLAGNRYAARKAFAELRAQVAGDDAQWGAAAAAMEALAFQEALARLDARYPAQGPSR